MKISVIGLGYVGLPLACALDKHFSVLGFDINKGRIESLRRGEDSTKEISREELQKSKISFTHEETDLATHADLFIVTVPTPVAADNKPDLGLIESAVRTIGKYLKAGSIVVFESTVYPGVTEDFCGRLLAEVSGLTCGVDFFLGYSPERINPGDKEHTVTKITKVIAGQNQEVCAILEDVYGRITCTFRATSIRVAEAAKVIENAQRDINIAFMNEITAIFRKDGLSIYDVLEAAGTKWNFLPFKPGLVGGHCIGVDPFYLADYAVQKGVNPKVILSGRDTNDAMSAVCADFIDVQIKKQIGAAGKNVLVLGLAFKEDVPDLRNTKVVDLVAHLKRKGYEVAVSDPVVNPLEAQQYYDIELQTIEDVAAYDCIVGAVAHDAFKAMYAADFSRLTNEKALVVDLKNMWKEEQLPQGLVKVTL